MTHPAKSSTDGPSLTPKQQAVMDYLREHPRTRQDDLADAMGSTLRGIGVVLSALTWNDDVALFSERGDSGAESTRWSVR